MLPHLKSFAKLTLLLGCSSLLLIVSCTAADKNIHRQESEVIVTAPAGSFYGTSGMTRGKKRYNIFRGIPYAEPPERFQAALPKAKLYSPYDATYDRSICPQKSSGQNKVTGSEDCLYLSVSTPHHDRCNYTINGLLAVMFWIHPGAYKGGNGYQYKPTYLLDECVVLVTINYRLAALGFLTTGDDVIPGNLGLKDQLIALKWTRDNIASFRGDPKRITIFGSSAGGSSVSHHICSRASKDLFHKAISMSGIVLHPWSIVENPAYYARKLASKLNCTRFDSTGVLSCLMQRSFQDIVNGQEKLAPPYIPFAPVIEPEEAQDPFQTSSPYKLLKSGRVNAVPFMAGFVEDEGIYYAAPILANKHKLQALNNHWDIVAPIELFYDQLDIPVREHRYITKSIKQYYFNGSDIDESQREQFVNLVSDRMLVQGTYETVMLTSEHMPTYLYVNTYKGGISFANLYLGYETPVITHVDDEQYIFPKFQAWTSGEQYEFSREMVLLWTNFAKYGIPAGKFTLRSPWRPLQSNKSFERIYRLDKTPSYFKDYLKDRTEFWRRVGIYKYEFYY